MLIAATGAQTGVWLLVAVPAISAAVLLITGRRADRWGHWLGAAVPGQRPRAVERLFDQPDDRVVLEAARGRDHQPVRLVVAPVEAGDAVTGQAVDRLRGAQHRPSERTVTEEGVREEVVHPVAGVVLGHGDLFEDDVTLGLDLLRRDDRAGAARARAHLVDRRAAG